MGFGTRSLFNNLIIKGVNATSFSDADDGNIPGGGFLGNIIGDIQIVRCGLRIKLPDNKNAVTTVGIFTGLDCGVG